MALAPLTPHERERALECVRGMKQHGLICKMLEKDDVPEPIYGIRGGGRKVKISSFPSFDALIDRLEARGFTLLMRDVPTRNNCGHDRFYSLRRTRDVRLTSPISESTELLVRRVPDDLPRVATARYA